MTKPVCQAAIDLVKHFEGLYLNAYLCPAGVPTIGYGHTEGVKMGQTITAQQAEDFLAGDLAGAAADVDRLVTVALNDDQRGALSSFVFNLGAGNLASSTLLRKLNAGDYAGAAAEFGKWVNAGGRKLDGLVKRRAAEADLFDGDTAPLPQLVDAPEGPEQTRIQQIQTIVGVKADGVYGPATKAAVASWQSAHGLTADGVVGPKTTAAMELTA
ncbi:glycoside hydrolase family protein [Azospirillum soli]|uniref:glycoside hydrolase family protein n=1 Tax=Azospirillum soli TaxID=1304799 RepID=UPI001B3B4A02|nr:lysozyme [Azospirillum soli]